MSGIVNQPALVDLAHPARRGGREVAASDAVAGIAEIATQTEQETGTDTGRIVTPGRQQFHPSAAKGWAKFDLAGTVNASENVSSVSDTGTGDWSVNWDTDFSSGDYTAVMSWRDNAGAADLHVQGGSQAAGNSQVIMRDNTTTLTDPGAADDMHIVAFGDQ